MKRLNSNILSIGITLLLVIVVVVSSLVTSHIVEQFEQEEQKKIELWAEATRQFILAGENENIDLLLQVMEGNTTIPVYMVDTNYNLLLSRNVQEPKRNVERFYTKKINELRATQEPIEVRISDSVMQYIYYEQSSTLQWLSYFPYIQLVVMLALAALAAIALLMVQRSEKNSLWVGLSKETAHQLGTPISSLNAWNELLKATYPNDPLLPQMDEDIHRLQMIAERFSKIGSQPTLEEREVLPIVQSAIDYMRARTSNKIEYKLAIGDGLLAIGDGQLAIGDRARAMLCAPLFEWVIENLCKNAIDAMDGKGSITISIQTALRADRNQTASLSDRLRLSDSDKIYIDITDTGKGIDRRNFKRIFQPGYTSKKRGWGLGLSLGKRIIEDYHRGKLFVKQSQLGVGTTFRIVLCSVV
ncbi:MAG: HAMP domain-containing histidine kinase [Paludibacteraceae bacterium]|nr:HAMP domain-containing histidine kinase [Paludibacteraceae bacterium]